MPLKLSGNYKTNAQKKAEKLEEERLKAVELENERLAQEESKKPLPIEIEL